MTQPTRPMRSIPDRPQTSHEPSGGQAWALYWFLFLAFWPRLFIFGLWIFGSQLGDAFSSWVIPALGFLLVPSTTLAYAFMWGVSSHGVHGAEWLVVAVGALLDLWMWGSLARLRS